MLGYNTLASAVALLSVASSAAAGAASILSVHGGNGVVATGFGIDLTGRYPRTGTGGDAGGDAPQFNLGNAPNPVCGKLFTGAIDVALHTQEMENTGVPQAYPNGSLVATMFQVDRPGGGPIWPEVSVDGTGNSWKNMTTYLNMAGNFGMQEQERVNSTVVVQFPSGTTCTGGTKKNLCLVRIRCGNGYNAGGCFVASLPAATYVSTEKKVASCNPGSKFAARSIDFVKRSAQQMALSGSQVNTIAKRVVKQMRDRGTVVKSAKRHVARVPGEAEEL